MIGSPAPRMTASDVVAIYDACEATGIHIWIDGGWSVDALLGKETRPHADLDIAIETGNVPALRKRLQVLNTGAQKSGCARLSLLAGSWEALLADIERKPSGTSPSILQTLAQAADCLRILLSNNGANSSQPLPQARVLSVDDDEICNEVAVTALKRANMAGMHAQSFAWLKIADYQLAG